MLKCPLDCFATLALTHKDKTGFTLYPPTLTAHTQRNPHDRHPPRPPRHRPPSHHHHPLRPLRHRRPHRHSGHHPQPPQERQRKRHPLRESLPLADAHILVCAAVDVPERIPHPHRHRLRPHLRRFHLVPRSDDQRLAVPGRRQTDVSVSQHGSKGNAPPADIHLDIYLLLTYSTITVGFFTEEES